MTRSRLGMAGIGAVALALWLPANARAQDSYLCNQAKSAKVPAQSKFTGVEIDAKDQFQPAGRNYLAGKYTALCNPTTGASQPTIHGIELSIKDSKVNPNASKFVKPTDTYLLTDSFVTDLPVTIVKPVSVRVRASKVDYGTITKCKVDGDCSDGDTCQSKVCLPPNTTPPAPPANVIDNFVCYSVKLGAKVTLPTNVPATDQFGNHGNYDLKKVTKLCAPADKDGENPGAENNPGHLTCYQAKPVKGATKFLKREAAVNSTNFGPQYLEAIKVTELCVPSTKENENEPTIPTTFTVQADNPGGVCGTLTTNLGGAEGVPLRRDPANATVDPNATCTGMGTPKLCCESTGTGHCDERTTVVCGSLSFGGGGPAVGAPGGESVNNAGSRTRYSLSCPSATGVCTISGNAGDRPNGVNCSTAGCGLTTPIESTSPVKVCALTKLASASSGSLDLATGEISLTNNAAAQVNILTSTSFPDTACPRCRTTTATTSAEVFSTGPGTPGVGVCDTDATNAGDPCFVFEPAGDTAGLTGDCDPDTSGGGQASIAINTVSDTAGASVSDPNGHFCPGQGGNSDCVAAGNPQICCTGAGMGSCNNFNGCFGSANAVGPKYSDTPAICTGISVTGSPAGPLVAGAAPVPGSFGDVACIPAVNAGVVLSGLVNNNAGLPGPVVSSTKVLFEVD